MILPGANVDSFCPTNGPLYAYSYKVDGNGNPSFVLAGQSDMVFAGQTVPTVTSLNGKAGTGIVSPLYGQAKLLTGPF